MKKYFFIGSLFLFGMISAQFNIEIESPSKNKDTKAIFYSLSGSKDIFINQVIKNNNKWIFTYPENYRGMMKVYFPESNKSFIFISENRDVKMKLNENLSDVEYLDEANKLMKKEMLLSQRQTEILPVLRQMKKFYNDGSAFEKSIDEEIKKLSEPIKIADQDEFIKFYFNHKKYLDYRHSNGKISQQEYLKFFVNTNEMLESSSILKPALIGYLSTASNQNEVSVMTQKLLDEVNIESPRGQIILSELLSIFDTYGLEDEKKKFFSLASHLTCSINENLKSSIESIKNTMIGAQFPDYIFTSHLKNSKVKKFSEIGKTKKLVLFWSSTCPHCLSELPMIIEKYKDLKNKGIEIVAFSLDTDLERYNEKVKSLPWINDSEIKGWNSSYVEKYNVHATPTYFFLDENNKILEKPNNFSTFLSSINLK